MPSALDRLVPSVRTLLGGSARGFLGNTCDRLVRTAGSEDAHGNVTYTYPAGATSLPCLYQARRVETASDGRGAVLIDTPSLLLPYDTPIQQGDRVQNVKLGSTVVLAGPVTVETKVPLPGLPDVYGWRAELLGASGVG